MEGAQECCRDDGPAAGVRGCDADTESAERREIIADAMRPVENLWKREDARLQRAGKGGAKALLVHLRYLHLLKHK
jgi:hypothetical protein